MKNVIKKPRGLQTKLRIRRARRDEDNFLIEDASGEEWIVVSG